MRILLNRSDASGRNPFDSSTFSARERFTVHAELGSMSTGSLRSVILALADPSTWTGTPTLAFAGEPSPRSRATSARTVSPATRPMGAAARPSPRVPGPPSALQGSCRARRPGSRPRPQASPAQDFSVSPSRTRRTKSSTSSRAAARRPERGRAIVGVASRCERHLGRRSLAPERLQGFLGSVIGDDGRHRQRRPEARDRRDPRHRG